MTKKQIFGTRDYMSPEILSGYIFVNGEIDKVSAVSVLSFLTIPNY